MSAVLSSLPMQGEDRAGPVSDDALRVRASMEQTLIRRRDQSVQARQRSGIEEIWQEDEDQYNGFDALNNPRLAVKDQGKMAVPGDAQSSQTSTLYMNVTQAKTQVAVSRVQEMLLPTDDRPWDATTTPIPEIEEAARGDSTMLTLADGTQRSAEDVARALKVKAQLAMNGMRDQIDDWFVECQIYAQMRRVIADAGRIGSGVLKGPIPKLVSKTRWKKDPRSGVMAMVKEMKVKPVSVAISAWDLYPDPSCGENIQDGSWVFEHDRLTSRKLRAMFDLPGVDNVRLAEVIQDGPKPMGNALVTRRNQVDGETSMLDSLTYDVFYYYGDLTAQDLIGADYSIRGLLDSKESDGRDRQRKVLLQRFAVPMVVMMVNDRIVRLAMSPVEGEEFPFDVFRWDPVEGQVWGRGIPRKINASQRIIVGATRRTMENAALSAGAQIVIDDERIYPANGRAEIVGRKLWKVKFRPEEAPIDLRFLFQVFTIPSATKELLSLVKFGQEMSDITSNLPMMMQGMVGNAPETVGGMKMLESSAASPLKTIAKQHDDDVMEPHVRRYYNWAMNDPEVPDEYKDSEIVCRARGASDLVRRETAAMFLLQTASVAQNPANPYRIDPAKWFAKVSKAHYLNASEVQYTDDQWKTLQDNLAKQGPPVDPSVQAAQIMRDAKVRAIDADTANKNQERAFRAEQAEQDRRLTVFRENIEFQIQAMEYAGQKQISFDQLRGILAAKTIESRDKRELFVAERALKMSPDNPTHEGI